MKLYPIAPQAVSIPEPRSVDVPEWGEGWEDGDAFDLPPIPEVDWSPPETVAVLYGPDGEVLRAWTDRPPVGYRVR